MTVSATYMLGCNVREVLETGVDGAANPVLDFSAFNVSGTINAASTPPATKQVQVDVPLVGGAKTIDLTALTGANGAAVTLLGLRVQILRIKNNGANNMTVSQGAANPWTGLGATFSFVVPPGGAVLFVLNDASPDVAAGVKNIDVAGTAVQSFELTVVGG